MLDCQGQGHPSQLQLGLPQPAEGGAIPEVAPAGLGGVGCHGHASQLQLRCPSQLKGGNAQEWYQPA